ncbi:acyl-CoA N-acyltransferase [Penicillium atrosanguineum]|uniref:DUF1772-domain-containing protein n=1 Tax=Penicillium atrosanguineum TaxID=1132637 RepID=A0A9W9U763_9EURO|nr:acyl-CoA N-acyltransferase [Penicillium atrosanguineum]KAJ5303998.1 acyl-CoA N-acyltransferase [Penicillium atrosanguineum]KAJ5323476.1 hypothetical protein N7476_002076 [Penicillium atrosanguineum]
MPHALYQPLLVASATIASVLTGCQLSLSYVSVAAILSAPDAPEYTALTMWKTTFNRGFYLCPLQAMLCSAIFAVNSIVTLVYGDASMPGHKGFLPLLIGGIISISLVPYTLVTIVPLEETLLERHGSLSRELNQGAKNDKVHGDTAGVAAAIQTRAIMRKWISLNYVRTLIPALTVVWAWTMC